MAVTLSITPLGASGTYAGPGLACSGYLVRAGDTTIWVDTGPGTLGRVQRHVDLRRLDAVVVSHAHPDHWSELPVLHNALRYGLGRSSIPVFTTGQTIERAEAAAGHRLTPTFDWTTITDGSRFGVGAVEISCSRTDHPVETLALRVDAGGRSAVYSADTGPDWSPARLGEGIDLFVCEASLTQDQEGRAQHLSGRQAGAMAAGAGVARLALTHLVPGVDPDGQRQAAERAFGGPVELAVEGRALQV